jgi:hypothetical protein
MYVQRNTEARWCNYYCRGKAINIKYYERVSSFLRYPACDACAVLHFHLWPVQLYHIFPHDLTNGTIFGKNLLNIKCVF